MIGAWQQGCSRVGLLDRQAECGQEKALKVRRATPFQIRLRVGWALGLGKPTEG